MTFTSTNPDLRRLARDVGLALALLLLTGGLWQSAERRGPQFAITEIAVIEGAIAGFTRIEAAERVPGRNAPVRTLRQRTAFWLEDLPPNLLFYQAGNSWQMENNVAIGAPVRLEVRADVAADVARARQYPEVTYTQPLDGLQVDGADIISASETLARAEAAARGFRRAAAVAGVAALGWIGWAAWRWRGWLARE
ncbi:MAG: hypothetical protein QM692_17235 [Thermomicrobiales bacterium]